MSATSSGSDKCDNGSSRAMGSSTKEAGEVTEGNVDNACNSQTHSTTLCTQCKTNPNLTGESDMSTPAQSQSKGENGMIGEKLAGDKEKGEKNEITPREQTKKPDLKETNIQSVVTVLENTEGDFVDDAMHKKDNIPSSKNYQEQHFHAERGKVPEAEQEAEQTFGQHNSSRKTHTKEESTNVVLSTLHAGNSNQADGTITSQADNSNLADGTITSLADNSNLADGTITSLADNSNLADGTITSQADNSNLADGTTIPQADNSNLADGTITSLADNSNLADGATCSSQEGNSNQGDVTTPKSQADNSNQTQGDDPNQKQEENPIQRDGMTSVCGNWDKTNRGAPGNTEKFENDDLFELQAENLDNENLLQSGKQLTNNTNGQREEGETLSEHPHVPFSSSQSQDDFTVIEYQLEMIIDDILTDNTLNENKEEWKKKSKKKIKGFLLTKVEDGTQSRRSFHHSVADLMGVHIFDSDINFAETDAKRAGSGQRADSGPSSSQHNQPFEKEMKNEKGSRSLKIPSKPGSGSALMSKTYNIRSEMTGDSGGRSPESLQTSISESFGEKGMDYERTHKSLQTPPLSGSGTSQSTTYRLKGSSSSSVSELELNQGHGRDSPKNDSRNEMTGDSGGGSPESLQTSDSESFGGPTSINKSPTKESGSSASGIAGHNLMIALGKGPPIPADGGKLLSKSLLAVTSQGQTGMSSKTAAKRDGTQSLRISRPSSSSGLPGPEFLSIQWDKGKEEDIEGNEVFELSLFRMNICIYIIQIACRPNDYHSLMFMFYNESTAENLKKSLYEKGYFLKIGTPEIHIRSKSIEKDPELIKNEIEEVIKKFKVDFSIQARCIESNFADDKLVEKCIEFDKECKGDKRGNIEMTYSKDKGLWIAGWDEEELKKHEKRLVEEVILQKNVIQDPTGFSHSFKDIRSKVIKDPEGGTPILPGPLQAADFESFADILLITLDGREKKFGPLPIGSSNEIKSLEIECNRPDFYKLSLIFQKEFLEKNDELKFFPRAGKFPSVGIIKQYSVGWVDIALKDVKTFLQKALPTITAKRQHIRNTSASLIDSWRKKVFENFGGDVQVFCDEDDATCLWFVSEHRQLIEKSLERLSHEDDYKEKESCDAQALLLYPLNILEMEMCMEFNLSENLRKKHKDIIKKISIDEAKHELAVTLMSKFECSIKKDIQIFLAEKKETKTIVRKIPKCFISFLKMPSFKEEIGTEIPCCIDANIDANEVHVYCNTLDDAKKVGRTITGLFQEETVDIEDLNSESLTLEKKVMEWKKEFSEMLDIEVTAKYIHMCGLRQIVEQILPKLKSFIQQNSRASSSTLNVKDEFDQAKDEHDDAALEGEIWFEKEEEVQCLKAKDFEKKIEEIKDRYQCSVNIKMENAYPLMKKQSKKWTWLFQSGQKVVLENAELKDVEANGSKCLISFLPETKQTIPGVCFSYADATIHKDILLATVILPIWRDEKAKEKEQLRSFISSLLQCLHERNISTVMIPLMLDGLLLQWPINKILKAILFWRRHFLDTTIFCHSDRDKCMKLLPVFLDMKDEPSRETIAIRIDKKSFTDEKVQVLVNTVGRDLNLKRGHVSNSILSAAGNEIQKEANAKFPNGLFRGQLLVTDAYNLRGKGILKVFHGSLLQWNEIESIAVIKSFVAKCLRLASENGMTSIAFPALGTGNLGYEHKSVATAMFETVRSFMEGSFYTSVKEVVFNAFDPKSQQAFFQEEKKYLNNPCQSGTFLPRTYTFPDNGVTFELRCGEVWTLDVKGLVVLYDSSEIFQKEEKTCIVECGKLARNFGGQYEERQKLQSRPLHIIRKKVIRPVEWIFYLTWHSGYHLETANLALKSAEEEKLDTLAFVISKKDGVAVKLDGIIKSVFASAKQTLKDSPLKRVIFVVDPALSSAANKTVEDNDIELYNNERKRCRVSFKCDSQTNLQNAKKDVMLALESLKNKRFNQIYKDETNALKAEDNQKGKGKPTELAQHENAKMLDNQSRSDEIGKEFVTFEESSSLILSIVSQQFLEQEMSVIKQKLTKDVTDVHVPVKIVFPFLNERDALLKFDSHEELNEFRKCFLNDHFQLNDLPPQVVTCLNATVSQTAKIRFIEHGWNLDDIVENSGVAIKIQNDCLVLEGSLLELQAARQFIQSACNKCKASAREIQNSTDVENESLEFNNAFDIQTPNRASQKEVSETGEDTFDARKKVQIEEMSNTNNSNKPENNLTKHDENVVTDILNSSISSSASIASRMECQEPVEQSIREKVYMSHLDYDIFENLFHLSSEITRKVHINRKKDVVEVVGCRDAVQPFREAMRDIDGYEKIQIDIKSTDLKKIQIHKKKIEELFPKVLVLLDEGTMYLICKEEHPDLKSIALSILSPQYKKENRGEKGRGVSDLGSDSDFSKMRQPAQKHSSVQKTTFGKIVFQRKDISVSVMRGDVLSFDGFDCLVSPTNEHLDLKKGGFSAAILARAGEEVQKECFKAISYKKKIEVGNCVSTTAGNLNYSLIIHTVVCPWKNFGFSKYRAQDALNHIKEVVSRCLILASKMKMKSIVFPAIGSGQSAIPHILLANGYRLGFETLQARSPLKEIYFVTEKDNFLSLIEKTFQTPLPWCSFWSWDDEYTYHVSNMCTVEVVKRDILQERCVDALVVLEDPFMSGKGCLASSIMKSGDQLYQFNRDKLMKKNRPNGSAVVCKYTGKLTFKTVVHITMPDSKIMDWKVKEVIVYKTCIFNALKSLKPTDRSIAMKLCVGGNKKRDVMMYFAKALVEAITEHITSKECTLQRILILNTDPVRHELVKEEFSRFTKNACNSNGYFESVNFVDCSSNLQTIETRL